MWLDTLPWWAELDMRLPNAEEVGLALQKALGSRQPKVLEIAVDGTQLAPPIRKDALNLPTRLLPKYGHLDYRDW